MTYDKITIELTNYKKEFWNLMMKGTKGNYENLKGGKISNEMFVLPYDSNKKYMLSVFHQWYTKFYIKYFINYFVINLCGCNSMKITPIPTK